MCTHARTPHAHTHTHTHQNTNTDAHAHTTHKHTQRSWLLTIVVWLSVYSRFYTITHARAPTRARTQFQSHARTHIPAHIRTRRPLHRHTHMCTDHTHTGVQELTYTLLVRAHHGTHSHTQTHAHTHTHAHMHTCMHTHTHAFHSTLTPNGSPVGLLAGTICTACQ